MIKTTETNKPTDEQVSKFWGWCGFKLINDIVWVDGKDNRIHKEEPIDLNNLFKYAVPKLDYVEIKCAQKAPFISVKVLHENSEYYGKDESPALALFWAIWEVVHS